MKRNTNTSLKRTHLLHSPSNWAHCTYSRPPYAGSASVPPCACCCWCDASATDHHSPFWPVLIEKHDRNFPSILRGRLSRQTTAPHFRHPHKPRKLLLLLLLLGIRNCFHAVTDDQHWPIYGTYLQSGTLRTGIDRFFPPIESAPKISPFLLQSITLFTNATTVIHCHLCHQSRTLAPVRSTTRSNTLPSNNHEMNDRRENRYVDDHMTTTCVCVWDRIQENILIVFESSPECKP